MTPGFTNLPVEESTLDGLNRVLLKPLELRRKDGTLIRAIVGTTTDGGSIPIQVQPIIPATGLAKYPGFVMHDAAYRDCLERFSENSGLWHPMTLDFDESNELLLECLELGHDGILDREAIFGALRIFGKFAFDKDRQTI